MIGDSEDVPARQRSFVSFYMQNIEDINDHAAPEKSMNKSRISQLQQKCFYNARKGEALFIVLADHARKHSGSSF